MTTRATVMPIRMLHALLLLTVGTLAFAAEPPARAVTAVSSVAIPVSDMDRAVDFYTHVLGFAVADELEASGDAYEHFLGVFGAHVEIKNLTLGRESIQLLHFLAPQGRPLPADEHANDSAFQHIALIVSDMDKAYGWLRDHHVQYASSGPQVLPEWNRNAGGIAAFYFRDPEGNFLEILHFPRGKGEPRWQQSGGLFLGIDHTAIVVTDTAASLRYYRDFLGLKVAGESDNYGTEQEHLNNVFGAHLRITALRSARGPGIELLEYLTPRTGRPIPQDSQANDRWYWQINLTTASPEEMFRGAVSRHVAMVSAGPVQLHSGALSIERGFVIRDPDGHAMAVASPFVGAAAANGADAIRNN